MFKEDYRTDQAEVRKNLMIDFMLQDMCYFQHAIWPTSVVCNIVAIRYNTAQYICVHRMTILGQKLL